MASPTFQFGKDDFERLIWDAALDPHTKVVALAIRWHMTTRRANAIQAYHGLRGCAASVTSEH